jgi:hypothetical protein
MEMSQQVSLEDLPKWVAKRFEGIGGDTNVKLPYCESARRVPRDEVRILYGERHRELRDDFIKIDYVLHRRWEIPLPFKDATEFLRSIPDEATALGWEAQERGEQPAAGS